MPSSRGPRWWGIARGGGSPILKPPQKPWHRGNEIGSSSFSVNSRADLVVVSRQRESQRGWHPSRMREDLGGECPAVSLRSTAGYTLRSLRDAEGRVGTSGAGLSVVPSYGVSLGWVGAVAPSATEHGCTHRSSSAGCLELSVCWGGPLALRTHPWFHPSSQCPTR